MLPLIKTLTDIIFLREGPERIPRAGVLFVMSLSLWLFSSLSAVLLIEQYDEFDFVIGVIATVAALAIYGALLTVSGVAERILQTLTAILGCSALLSFAFIAEHTLVAPFLGERVSTIIGRIIVFWSVPVEGHIIARALGRHFYLGFLIAFVVFIMQILLLSAIAANS